MNLRKSSKLPEEQGEQDQQSKQENILKQSMDSTPNFFLEEKENWNQALYQEGSCTSSSSNLFTFDDLLSEIGFCRYQIVTFILMGLIGAADAAESQVLSILQPILSTNWGLHQYEESLLVSLVFVGYFIGSSFSGKVSDTQGRKKPLKMGSIFLFICALASSLSPNYILFVIFRVCFGGGIGFIVPISFSVLAETTPLKQRGIVLALIGIFYTLGELFVCLLAFCTLDNLKTGNWRLLLILSCIPSFMIMVGAIVWVDESPRFLLVSGKYDQAFQIIKKMIKFANKDETLLSEYHQQQITLWSEETRKQMQGFESGTIKSLFQGPFAKITPIIWYNWFVSSFVYFGITFILPLTLTAINGEDDSGDDDLKTIFLSCIGELPAIVVCAIIVNIPFLGRKNSWGICYFGGFVGCLFIFLELGSFTFWVTFSKLALDLAFTLSYEYTGEIYPTKIRAQGVGIASSYSRIGSILMPWIGTYIGDIGTFIPYLIFSITCGIASFLTFFLPFDTLGKALDTF